MGQGMTANLLKGGHSLTVYDLRPENAIGLIEAGATWAGSSREVAQDSEVTVVMVPDSSDVEEVVLGEEGVLEGAKPGSMILVMSTFSPVISRDIGRRCLEKGVHYMDAPVSGGSIGAQNGTLAIMAGGEEDDFNRVLPLLKLMGREEAIFYVGPVGSGLVVKIVNNMLGGTITALCAEALSLGVKAGVAPEKIAEIVTKSSGSNWQLANAYPRNVFSRAFKPGFYTCLMHKDLGLGLQLAEDLGVNVSIAAQARKLYDAALAEGYALEDYTSVVKPVEKAGGVVLSSKVITNGS
jgi:3-hydroxyisobutyrate dehydrogenase